MKAAVVQFPGSNCDRDMAVGFRHAGFDASLVWHKETALPEGVDVVGVPGGFSYGDYLRCGAIAAQSPIMRAVKDFAAKGGHVLGVCNGFQVLCETQMLPGVLMRNAGLKFVCRSEPLEVATADSPFTNDYSAGQGIDVPIAHHDGNYQIDDEGLTALRSEDRIAFTYRDNPNGSRADIAGVLSANRRVLGMMPHPERAIEDAQGGADGASLFAALAGALVAA